MKEKTTIEPRRDHVRQWVALKQLYARKRGSDADRNKKAIPRTTNGDAKQLVQYWHGEYLSDVIGKPKALDRSLASRKEWVARKRALDRALAGADPNATYRANEQFWHDTGRLAIYLESRKAIPTRTEIFFESVGETVSEHVDSVKDLASDAIDKVSDAISDTAWSAIKTGGLILGGVVGAAIAIPAIVRALKD